MTAGFTPTVVSGWLNGLAATAGFVKFHVGDPGPVGTANPSAVTTRPAITYTASAAGSPLTASNQPSVTATATETISYISVWDAASAGNFQFSGVAQVPAGVNSGDTVLLNSLNIAILPQAA